MYKKVGGNVHALYQENPEGYANACALRLSLAFNYGGVTITRGGKGYKVPGADGKPYLLRVDDMIKFVRANFGEPDVVVKPKGQDKSSEFKSKKGIIVFRVTGWGDATGHVTLWNGADCGDTCYFTFPPLFGLEPKTTEILFWELK
ncbi:MAG: type VI secretion system amidase effector protein Tae4 [Pseudomonadota bacterium]